MEQVQILMSQALSRLPLLLKPLAILVVGWVVVSICSAMVRRLLRRLGLNRFLNERLGGTDIAAEEGVGKAAQLIGMTFVVIAVLEALELRTVSQPLNAFLASIFNFMPRLLGAAALLLVAFAIGTTVRALSRRTLQRMGVDNRLADSVRQGETPVAMSQTVSDTLYWAVFLLFIPAVLDALSLGGMLAPLQHMIDTTLSALPNVVSAGLVVLVGWFAARTVQRVLTNLLAAAGADRVVQDASVQLPRKPSELIGFLVYALILVPVTIAGLNQLGLQAVTRPASAMLETLLAAIPQLLGATLILTIAYFAGKLVSGLVGGLLSSVGFDRVPERLGLPAGATPPSALAGQLAMVTLMAFATVEALQALGFSEVSLIMSRLIQFGGHVLLGSLILAVGLYLGRVVAEAIRNSALPQASKLALAARIAVLVLSTAMGLSEMGLADDIIRLAFGLTLGAVAVAAALSFGLGGRDTAAQVLRRFTTDLPTGGGGFARGQAVISAKKEQ